MSSVSGFLERIGRYRKPQKRHRGLSSCCPETLEKRLLLFALGPRWSTTATDGSGLLQGDATTLTWNLVPDGTPIAAMSGVSGESSSPSNLVAFMNGIYGAVTNDANYTDEIWFTHFQSVFDRWSELSGVTYVYVPYDDGASLASAAGVLGVRADVRIGGHRIDGNSGVLAYNFYPNIGDMVIDTADSFYSTTTGNSIRLRNVLAHEAGHGLGLNHVNSSDAGILLEPFISTSFDGPQFDDILGLQRHYGDDYETGTGNETAASATSLGALGSGQTITIGADAHSTVVTPSMTDFVSIDDESDIDFYSFTVSAAGSISINLTPMGPTYLVGPQGGSQTSFNASAQSDLTLALYDRNGSTILATANSTGIGGSEAIGGYFLPTAGTYFARVSASTLNKIQTYKLDITNESTATPELSIADVTVGEADGTATFTVSLNMASAVDVSFNYATANVTAIAGSDYVSTSGSRTIPAGQTSTSITVQILNDDLPELTETFTVTISGAVGAGIARGVAIGTILDDDALALTLTVSPGTFSEGAGSQAATGTVTRNSADLSSSQIVNLSSSDTTEATVPASVTIPAGESSASFFVAAVDDAIVDGSQLVTISATATGFISGTANVTVTDNDVVQQALTLTVSPGTFSEGAGSQAATGTVTRISNDLSASLTVNLSSSDTTEATVPTSITIPAGESSASFFVAAVDDAIVDGSQVVTISATATGFISGTANVTVTDNDGVQQALTVTVSPGTFSEGAGSQAATGTVTRISDDLSASLIVNLSSSDTTEATVPTSVTIPAGQSSTTFFVAAVDDAIVDGSQLVTISAMATGFISGTANVTVTDNDGVQQSLTLTVSPGTFSEGAGSQAATGTVTRNSDDLGAPLIVNLSSSDTTEATVPASVTIPAGQSSTTFFVAAVDDAIVDGSQFVFVFAAAAGYTSSIASIVVTDNDMLALTLEISPATFSEGAGSSAAIGTVTRNSAGVFVPLTVNLTSSDTTEATVPASVTIPSGQMSATFAIAAVDDTIVDGSQSVTITAAAANYVSAAGIVTVTDNDNDNPTSTPTTPVILQPVTTEGSQRPLIAWTASVGATSYEIWIGNQSTNTNPWYLATVTGTSHVPSMDLGIGRFNLWIRARNDHGVSAWTTQYQFRIQTRVLLIPIDRFQEIYRPTIDWEPLAGAVRYDLWMDHHSAGISQYIRDQNVPGTAFTPDSDLPLGSYRVWVRGIAADGWGGNWSLMQEFLVMPAPEITHGMNSTFDRSPTFAWKPSPGAVHYEVSIRNQSTGLTVLHVANHHDASWTAAADLPDGSYRWWALAVGANGFRSYWTAPMDIYIGGRSQILTPADLATQFTPAFTWKPVDGAIRYELWADRIGVQVGYINETQLTGTSFTPSTPLPTGSYRIWVRAVSATNEFSPWSLQWNFTIVADTTPDVDPGTIDHLLTGQVVRQLPRSAVSVEQNEGISADKYTALPQRSGYGADRRDEPTADRVSDGSDTGSMLPMPWSGEPMSAAELNVSDDLQLAELWAEADVLLRLF